MNRIITIFNLSVRHANFTLDFPFGSTNCGGLFKDQVQNLDQGVIHKARTLGRGSGVQVKAYWFIWEGEKGSAISASTS